MSIDISLFNNIYIVIIIALFLTWYTYTASKTRLPKNLTNLFNNPIFRIAFLALLATLNFNQAPHIIIMLTLIYVLTIFYIRDYDNNENFAYLQVYNDISKEDK